MRTYGVSCLKYYLVVDSLTIISIISASVMIVLKPQKRKFRRVEVYHPRGFNEIVRTGDRTPGRMIRVKMQELEPAAEPPLLKRLDDQLRIHAGGLLIVRKPVGHDGVRGQRSNRIIITAHRGPVQVLALE